MCWFLRVCGDSYINGDSYSDLGLQTITTPPNCQPPEDTSKTATLSQYHSIVILK